MMSRSVNLAARCCLSLTARDCSGAFRCYRVSVLRQLNWSQIRSVGYSFQEEILWHLARLGARFREVPIVFTDRQHGASKINSREAVRALGVFCQLGLKNWLAPRSKVAAEPGKRRNGRDGC
jgi:dolichol-phosphate mannosyltransferase